MLLLNNQVLIDFGTPCIFNKPWNSFVQRWNKTFVLLLIWRCWFFYPCFHYFRTSFPLILYNKQCSSNIVKCLSSWRCSNKVPRVSWSAIHLRFSDILVAAKRKYQKVIFLFVVLYIFFFPFLKISYKGRSINSWEKRLREFSYSYILKELIPPGISKIEFEISRLHVRKYVRHCTFQSINSVNFWLVCLQRKCF